MDKAWKSTWIRASEKEDSLAEESMEVRLAKSRWMPTVSAEESAVDSEADSVVDSEEGGVEEAPEADLGAVEGSEVLQTRSLLATGNRRRFRNPIS